MTPETPEERAISTRFFSMIYDNPRLSADYDETYFIVTNTKTILYRIKRVYVYKHPIEQVKRVCDMAYRQSQEALKGVICDDRIQFRCGCCGEWQWMFYVDWQALDPEEYKYCEGCKDERTGQGRGQCVYCKMYPKMYWDQERPDLPYIHVCMR